jgi:hypothetical protein
LLTELSGKADDYASNMLAGYDIAVDNILTDSAKLATAGALSSDPDSGWHIRDLASGEQFSVALVAGAKTSFWTQVLPSLIGERTAVGMNTKDPATFGSEVYNAYQGKYYCASVYAAAASGTVPAEAMTAYPHVGDGLSNKWDVAFLAENPTPQTGAGAQDFAVSSELAKLLTTNQSVTLSDSVGPETGINIPPMMMINNAPIMKANIALFNPGKTCYVSN